jgi:hypothetical protein
VQTLIVLLEIGQGAFGEVWKGKWRKTPVAIKKHLESNNVLENETQLQLFEAEALLMK